MGIVQKLIDRAHKCWRRETRASVSTMTALSLVALGGLVGIGLDVAVWYANGRRIQTMVESSALSAGRLLSNSSATTTSITAVAQNGAVLNGFTAATDTISVGFGPSSPPNATTVTVTVRRKLPLLFSSLFLGNSPTVSASATASNIGSSPVCIYVLAAAAAQTLLVNSNFTLNAPNCEIDVASTASPAAIFNAGATLTVKQICIAGTATNNGATIGNLATDCTPHANPYKDKFTAPTIAGCSFDSANYSGSVYLNPGTYCGTFNFNATGSLNLAPGLYVLNGTNWTINSGWTVAGTGVTFYFADSSSYVQFNSGVTASLSAPTSGTYANLLIFEPDGLSTSGFAIDGTSASGHALQGLVYLPSRNLTLNATYSGSADSFTLVVNQLIFDSNSPRSWSITPSSGGGASGVVVLTN